MNDNLPIRRALAPFVPPERLTADKLKGPTQVRLLGSEARQAQNDEPEPLFTEAELLQADRDRQVKKDEECRNLTRACDEREMRRQHVGSEWDRATWMRNG